jgi:hypothetical protein
MSGQIGILNVGAGDTKLTFDRNNPAEMIRSARIVTDMLRRGYALLVEVKDRKGNKSYTRVHEFREDTCEYIIADFDPVIAAKEDTTDERNTRQADEPAATPPDGTADGESRLATPRIAGGKRRGTRAVSASGVTGIAVSRSAGG